MHILLRTRRTPPHNASVITALLRLPGRRKRSLLELISTYSDEELEKVFETALDSVLRRINIPRKLLKHETAHINDEPLAYVKQHA